MPTIIPAYPVDSPLQQDTYWQNQLLFHEYFHAETGQGLGASHQNRLGLRWVSMLLLNSLMTEKYYLQISTRAGFISHYKRFNFKRSVFN